MRRIATAAARYTHLGEHMAGRLEQHNPGRRSRLRRGDGGEIPGRSAANYCNFQICHFG